MKKETTSLTLEIKSFIVFFVLVLSSATTISAQEEYKHRWFVIGGLSHSWALSAFFLEDDDVRNEADIELKPMFNIVNGYFFTAYITPNVGIGKRYYRFEPKYASGSTNNISEDPLDIEYYFNTLSVRSFIDLPAEPNTELYIELTYGIGNVEYELHHSNWTSSYGTQEYDVSESGDSEICSISVNIAIGFGWGARIALVKISTSLDDVNLNGSENLSVDGSGIGLSTEIIAGF